eukprot:s4848_g3.t1
MKSISEIFFKPRHATVCWERREASTYDFTYAEAFERSRVAGTNFLAFTGLFSGRNSRAGRLAYEKEKAEKAAEEQVRSEQDKKREAPSAEAREATADVAGMTLNPPFHDLMMIR